MFPKTTMRTLIKSLAPFKSNRKTATTPCVPLFASNYRPSESLYFSTKTAPAVSSSSSSSSSHQHQLPMFCRQCEQTQHQTACTSVGVCGKTAETSALQDALLAQVGSVSYWMMRAKNKGRVSKDILTQTHAWTVEAVFSTLTNVNFDDQRICEFIHQGAHLQHILSQAVSMDNNSTSLPDGVEVIDEALAALDLRHSSIEDLEDFGAMSPYANIPKLRERIYHGSDDAMGLHELALYGIKGVCAYTAHIQELLHHSPGSIPADVMAKNDDTLWEIQRLINVVASNPTDIGKLLETVMQVGALAFEVLGSLDQCHDIVLGTASPTNVRVTAVAGPAILVSGHDMVDLKVLLEQTAGTGINVYTHGEMLPAHAYPELSKHKHLAGNYGTAWQNQKFEFAGFPGPIVVTTNCVVAPRRNYRNRLYTMNATGVDGVAHIDKRRDFSGVIERALSMPGFPSTIEPAQYLTVGFNHRAVLPLADTVLDAVSAGKLSRIFVIGGCDGTQWDRNYFTDLAEETPDDSVILTLGCAKNRLIRSHKLLGATLNHEEGALPRVLDMGQCNDAYSAVVVASALASKLGCTVNDLPLSLAISHLEQKAVAVLLALLHLGVKNIRLGPSLPAYLTPNLLNVLSGKFNLMPTTDYKSDMAAMMQGK